MTNTFSNPGHTGIMGPRTHTRIRKQHYRAPTARKKAKAEDKNYLSGLKVLSGETNPTLLFATRPESSKVQAGFNLFSCSPTSQEHKLFLPLFCSRSLITSSILQNRNTTTPQLSRFPPAAFTKGPGAQAQCVRRAQCCSTNAQRPSRATRKAAVLRQVSSRLSLCLSNKDVFFKRQREKVYLEAQVQDDG